MGSTKKYIVVLSDEAREQLGRLCENYRYSPRERTRAKVLLLCEQGHSDVAIASQVSCHWMTVRNVRLRFCTRSEDLSDLSSGSSALPEPVKAAKTLVKHTEQKRRAKRAFDGEQEAHLVALACSTPPDGASRWTLQLLHDRLIENQVVVRVGKETIRQTLKKRAQTLAEEVLVHSSPRGRPLCRCGGRPLCRRDGRCFVGVCQTV